MYLVPFLRYAASNNGVTLKLGVGVVQGRWKWHSSIDHGPYTTQYWSAVVITALCCTIFSYLTLNKIVTFESGLRVTQGHWKWYHSKDWVRFAIRIPCHSNYGRMLCCFRGIAIYWSKIAICSYPLHSTPPLGGPRRNISVRFVWENYNGVPTCG